MGYHPVGNESKRCTAKPGNCPYLLTAEENGEPFPHYETKEEGDAWLAGKEAALNAGRGNDTLSKKPHTTSETNVDPVPPKFNSAAEKKAWDAGIVAGKESKAKEGLPKSKTARKELIQKSFELNRGVLKNDPYVEQVNYPQEFARQLMNAKSSVELEQATIMVDATIQQPDKWNTQMLNKSHRYLTRAYKTMEENHVKYGKLDDNAKAHLHSYLSALNDHDETVNDLKKVNNQIASLESEIASRDSRLGKMMHSEDYKKQDAMYQKALDERDKYNAKSLSQQADIDRKSDAFFKDCYQLKN